MPNILVVDVVLLGLTEAELEVARLSFLSLSLPCLFSAMMGLHLIILSSLIISHIYFILSFYMLIVELKSLVTKFYSHYSAL